LVSVDEDMGTRLYDIETFQEIRLGTAPDGHNGAEGPHWAGATGRLFGYTSSSSRNWVKTLVLNDGFGQHYRNLTDTPWYVMPGPDDKYVYVNGRGVLSDHTRPVENEFLSPGASGTSVMHAFLPSHHGPYYLRAWTGDEKWKGRPKVENAPTGTVWLFAHGNDSPIATYERTAVCPARTRGELSSLGIEHSIHLIPRAKLLVIVPASRDELRLYPADLEAALEKADHGYLLITSTAPGSFQTGKVFSYQAEARTSKGPVLFRLVSAPDGMTVDDMGLVRWSVPTDLTKYRADVVLSARDAIGREVSQSFTLIGRGAE